mmetsp:Transcript_14745/g.43255  ORF Transcript_14745/g.43255 Transcript_14745/m.43255 type:complete len:237 (+) Transcript_14745:1848-2558(+)
MSKPVAVANTGSTSNASSSAVITETMLSLSPPIKSSDRSASCATPDAVPTAADASLLLRMRRAALAFSFAFSSLIRDLRSAWFSACSCTILAASPCRMERNSSSMCAYACCRLDGRWVDVVARRRLKRPIPAQLPDGPGLSTPDGRCPGGEAPRLPASAVPTSPASPASLAAWLSGVRGRGGAPVAAVPWLLTAASTCERRAEPLAAVRLPTRTLSADTTPSSCDDSTFKCCSTHS